MWSAWLTFKDVHVFGGGQVNLWQRVARAKLGNSLSGVALSEQD